MQSIEDLENAWQLPTGYLRNIEVIAAEYTYEDYSGSAFCLYRENGKLYTVHGSHCSCYGLENQWSPEEISAAAVRHLVTEGSVYSGYEDDILAALSRFEKGKRVKRVMYFEASDGTRFDDENECLNYEQICELEDGICLASTVDRNQANAIARWFVETYTFEAK